MTDENNSILQNEVADNTNEQEKEYNQSESSIKKQYLKMVPKLFRIGTNVTLFPR